MMESFMDIGDSKALRLLISNTDVVFTTIPVIIDKPRTLKVISKQTANSDSVLVVRCTDLEDCSIVILHLPYKEGARASAHLIQRTNES